VPWLKTKGGEAYQLSAKPIPTAGDILVRMTFAILNQEKGVDEDNER
jgi:hypothetical protein